MAGRRIEMQKLKEVLRLRLVAGLSNRKIAIGTRSGQVDRRQSAISLPHPVRSRSRNAA